MGYHFLDTSAVLQGGLDTYPDCFISTIVLSELENIKTAANKDDQIKYLARQAVRTIIDSPNIITPIIPQRKYKHWLKKYPFLSDINDHRLICEAAQLAYDYNQDIYFVTNDSAQYVIAQQIKNLIPILYSRKENYVDDNYCGWSKHYLNDKQLELLYTDPKINSLKCKTNEYAKIYQGTELKDILMWTGDEYRPLKYKDIRNHFLDEVIKPRNIEQKMAFDLLQNPDIPVKLISGAVGAGKDFLMLSHALDLVQRGTMNKIIYVRNLVPFKDAPEIGFLQGNLQEKIAWGMGPLASILGTEGLKAMEEQGLIEAVNLGFIRGMSWDKVILYVSEGQNITGGGYKLLVSRCGEGSQLWVNGDILQTDKKVFEQNNGINRLLHSLSGNPLFGTVKLLKSERSAVAELATAI